MIDWPASECWPQACAADWLAHPPEVWAATLAVAVLAGLASCAILAAGFWLAARLTNRAANRPNPVSSTPQ